ncbi:Zn-dependent exopeptidase, partial [Anaeromyces robustus]
PGNRIILAPVKTDFNDVDDVRIYGEMGKKVMKRIVEAGIKKPIFYFATEPINKDGIINKEFVNFIQVTLLGALSGLYIPLEAREFLKKGLDIIKIGIMIENESENFNEQLKIIEAYQHGRQLAQDIGGTSPERGNPLQCAEIIEQAFKETNVEIKIIKDYNTILKEYPLMAAVARSSSTVPKHIPCVVKLTYKSPDQSHVKDNLFFIGKGVTFDSGGMDLKVGGAMRHMCRDKGGASICAGIVYIAQKLALEQVNITAYLGFVRNSIGSHSYVCDEVITSRSGRRVLVANTDAEGRMTMGDLLTEAKENIIANKLCENSKIFTIATLTGHSVRAYGAYPVAVENVKARNDGIGRTLQDLGQIWGDPFEISRIRRDDFIVVKGNGISEDVIQCNDKPSTMTCRGHQFPVAFLINVSRLDEHSTYSDNPIAYTHLDISGSYQHSTGDWGLGEVTGNPIIAIASSFL